ncbi:MAG: CDP-6-deoxy-delta-3,4-glucoseen reductase [Comamonas sp.]|nr:CDP-6-deoxy-delta-3,4-glucoseen reductase [Comamonas sp.]
MTATAFPITVEPSGRQFSAHDSETILAAAISAGVGLPYGCKDGACGSCKCKKLSGDVTHANYSDNALSSQELADGYVLTCRATAHSPVVLVSKHVTDAHTPPIKKMPVRVAALEKLSHDVMRVQLQLPAHTVLQYFAGQYIEFILRDGSRRAYSIATAPHVQHSAPGIELHIRHMPGGLFTDHVFGGLKEKEILRVEGPFGSFYLREDSSKPLVFLASGTGFAPLKGLLTHIQHHGITRPVSLYWGGRRPEDLYQDDWVKALAAAMPHLTYVPVVSDAQPQDHWTGRSGYVHQAVLDDFADLSGHEVYACGAPIVVDSARSSYTSQRGLPKDAFFADAFTSAADK